MHGIQFERERVTINKLHCFKSYKNKSFSDEIILAHSAVQYSLLVPICILSQHFINKDIGIGLLSPRTSIRF